MCPNSQIDQKTVVAQIKKGHPKVTLFLSNQTPVTFTTYLIDLPFFGLTVRVTVQVPRFKALTFEPSTLQVLLKLLFILIVTFALAGSVFAMDASMHVEVALLLFFTTQGFGLQSAREVARTGLYVNAGHAFWAFDLILST